STHRTVMKWSSSSARRVPPSCKRRHHTTFPPSVSPQAYANPLTNLNPSTYCSLALRGTIVE
ncbi:MAG TPA: hypothetical protein PK589_14690, partial [Nitrospira sp.]|nr:hypothetical protein [Nitrospira sp.]